MGDKPEEHQGIFVDSDWKEQARREKEELDRQTREEGSGPDRLPDPSILEVIQMVVMQASLGLGGYQDPQTGQVIPPNLALAKHYIDLLALVHAKTVANLDEHEKAVIEGTLHELRMAFVQMAGVGAAPEKP